MRKFKLTNSANVEMIKNLQISLNLSTTAQHRALFQAKYKREVLLVLDREYITV